LAFATPFSFVSAIENVGADTLFNLKTICEVYRNGTRVHLDSSQTISFLAPTDTALTTFANSFTASNTGDYYVRYYPKFNGNDIDSSNNFYITDTLSITDSTYARDNDILNSSIGIGPGIQGELGVRYAITQVDTSTSVDVYIANVNGQMNNQPLSVNIRSFSSTPSSLIASSDTISFTGPGGAWVNLPFSSAGGNVPLGL
jgi:hypothetical protein